MTQHNCQVHLKQLRHRMITLYEFIEMIDLYEFKLFMFNKEYIIRVQRGTESKLFWTIRKRYREFDELNNALRSYNYDLKLPGKKLFGNMNKEFISDRQTGLQVNLK